MFDGFRSGDVVKRDDFGHVLYLNEDRALLTYGKLNLSIFHKVWLAFGLVIIVTGYPACLK